MSTTASRTKRTRPGTGGGDGPLLLTQRRI